MPLVRAIRHSLIILEEILQAFRLTHQVLHECQLFGVVLLFWSLCLCWWLFAAHHGLLAHSVSLPSPLSIHLSFLLFLNDVGFPFSRNSHRLLVLFSLLLLEELDLALILLSPAGHVASVTDHFAFDFLQTKRRLRMERWELTLRSERVVLLSASPTLMLFT